MPQTRSCQCGQSFVERGGFLHCTHCDMPGCNRLSCTPCARLKKSDGIGPRGN